MDKRNLNKKCGENCILIFTFATDYCKHCESKEEALKHEHIKTAFVDN